MKAPALVSGCLFLGLSACATSGPEFRGAVSALEDEYGVQASHWSALAPLVRVAGPAGVSGFDAATLETLPARAHEAPDAAALRIQKALGVAWKLVVRASSRAEGEWTLVYANPSDGKWRLMVFTLDDETLTVAHLALDPAHLREWLEEKVGHT